MFISVVKQYQFPPKLFSNIRYLIMCKTKQKSNQKTFYKKTPSELGTSSQVTMCLLNHSTAPIHKPLMPLNHLAVVG